MSKLPDLSRFKAQQQPAAVAGQKRRSKPELPSSSAAAAAARPSAGARDSMFSRPGTGRRTSSSTSTSTTTTSSSEGGAAPKPVRLNALYPEFLQETIKQVLVQVKNNTMQAMTELDKLSKQVEPPAVETLEPSQRQPYERLRFRFNDYDPDKVLAALYVRRWNEQDTATHLEQFRRIMNTGQNVQQPVPAPAAIAPTTPSRSDFYSTPFGSESSRAPRFQPIEVLDDDDERQEPVVSAGPMRKFRRGAPPSARSTDDSSSSSSKTATATLTASSSPQSTVVAGTSTTTKSESHQSNGTSAGAGSGSVRMGRPPPGGSTLRASATAPTRRAAPLVVSDESGGEEEEEAAEAEAASGSDDGSEADDDGEPKNMLSAIEWFNKASESALCETIGCSVTQAATIARLRPYADEDDVDTKLGDRSAKGVTPRLFHACTEVMAGYQQVDRILQKVEMVGGKLMRDMHRWDLQIPQLSAVGNSSKSKQASPISAAKARSEGYLSEQPAGLSTDFKLKPYQLIGVNWLMLLYNHSLSAILADEMGLGKTVQVISFLLALKARGQPGPHLVVAPSSVLENWRRELEQAAPSDKHGGLHVAVYWGSQKERDMLRDEIADMQDEGELDVVLTTYDMASAGGTSGKYDAKFFRKRDFNVCIYDEGHMLKNRRSERYQKLMRIPAKRRLLLTGTPLQNHLGELLSLLNFILPSFFGSTDTELLEAIFKAKPATTNAGSQSGSRLLSTERVERAKALMKPFVLRRRKEKVLAHELAGKEERVIRCEMTAAQAQVYADVLAGARQSAQQEQPEDDDGKTTKKTVKAKQAAAAANKSGHILMDLRKAANHPLLFRRRYDDKKIAALARDYVKNPDFADEPLEHVKEDFTINSDASLSQVAASYSYTKKHILPSEAWLDSGKVKALQQIIEEATAKGERVLLFSQFTTVLDILCEALHVLGIKYLGFTGATRVEDRQELVDQFTRDESIPVFLLTTRAGGVGINLTAANWVVLYDQDFNPHNDKQAIDRAHRLGQTRNVTVIRVLSKDTIDDQIYTLGTRKLELAQRVSDDHETGRTPKKVKDTEAEEDPSEAMNDTDIQQLVGTSIMAQIRASGGSTKA